MKFSVHSTMRGLWDSSSHARLRFSSQILRPDLRFPRAHMDLGVPLEVHRPGTLSWWRHTSPPELEKKISLSVDEGDQWGYPSEGAIRLSTCHHVWRVNSSAQGLSLSVQPGYLECMVTSGSFEWWARLPEFLSPCQKLDSPTCGH